MAERNEERGRMGGGGTGGDRDIRETYKCVGGDSRGHLGGIDTTIYREISSAGNTDRSTRERARRE